VKSQVKCRQCGKPVQLDPSNPWRPFCSERCKLLDLGGWFGERYTIPAENPDESSDAEPGDPPMRHQ
jgi:endogenous inhibitor of DNA gyrase (YacG/DUF329 family)